MTKPAVALLAWLSVSLLLTGCETPVLTPTLAETPSPPATASTVAAPALTATSEVIAEPGCLEPPPLDHPASTAVKAEGEVGVGTTLEARGLFELPEAVMTFRWEQVFGTAQGVEYLTSHRGELSGASTETARFTPLAPGNYRFRLTASDEGGLSQIHTVDVWVTQETAERWEVKGAIFADLWGPMGGPEFDVAPEDPECLARALDHAYAGPLRVGAGWVGFVPASFIVEVNPPVLRPEENYHSLTDDEYYTALVGAAHERGLKVVQFEQDSPHFELSPEEMAELRRLQGSDPAWWESWFDQWKVWVVQRAARAEANGVEMFVPYLMADGTFRPDVYPDYDERWREILEAIREVYSGTLAMSFVNADERLTFVDAFDVGLVTVFGGMYTSTDMIADKQNPTLEELIEVNESFLSFPQPLIQAGMPIYYILVVNSSDGQVGSEVIEEIATFRADFGEQALYYEAFFKVASESTWIKGVFTERWDWFDQYRRPPEGLYFDETTGASPRSKPAEEVVRLWFSTH